MANHDDIDAARRQLREMIDLIDRALGQVGAGSAPANQAGIAQAFADAVRETVKQRILNVGFPSYDANRQGQQTHAGVFLIVESEIASTLSVYAHGLAKGALQKQTNLARLASKQQRDDLAKFILGQTLADFGSSMVTSTAKDLPQIKGNAAFETAADDVVKFFRTGTDQVGRTLVSESKLTPQLVFGP